MLPSRTLLTRCQAGLCGMLLCLLQCTAITSPRDITAPRPSAPVVPPLALEAPPSPLAVDHPELQPIQLLPKAARCQPFTAAHSTRRSDRGTLDRLGLLRGAHPSGHHEHLQACGVRGAAGAAPAGLHRAALMAQPRSWASCQACDSQLAAKAEVWGRGGCGLCDLARLWQGVKHRSLVTPRAHRRDMAHLLSIVVLLLKIRATRSCRGEAARGAAARVACARPAPKDERASSRGAPASLQAFPARRKNCTAWSSSAATWISSILSFLCESAAGALAGAARAGGRAGGHSYVCCSQQLVSSPFSNGLPRISRPPEPGVVTTREGALCGALHHVRGALFKPRPASRALQPPHANPHATPSPAQWKRPPTLLYSPPPARSDHSVMN